MQHSLKNKLGASEFLSKLSEPLDEINQNNALDWMAKVCQQLELHTFDVDSADALDEAQKQLIQAKKEFTFAWSLVELERLESQAQIGQWQTRFAEASIGFALRLAWQQVANKHKVIKTALAKHQNNMPGLFVFGMGKLGGYDLNFSSDVDLVAYFDPDTLPVPDVLGKGYVCHQVLQILSQLLGQKGHRNFIWRVDWRLRPNASATTLAMSVDAAREYYFYQASPWHRLALMKARVVAGDKRCGEQFLNILSPFIWRQNLDYRALDELAQIKQRINLEHPALRVQRTWREPISEDVAGFNVKLGSGGIREIEFIANALQLVWGGKQYSLRVPNTVQALQALAEKKLIDKPTADQLIDSYHALRRIENAIQMRANLQTHLIPQSSKGQDALLVLLSEQSWQVFVEKLNDHRRVVNKLFVTLFAEQESEHTEAIVWPNDLNDQAGSIVDAWENGFHSYGVTNQVRHKLRPLARALSNVLNESKSEDVSTQVIRLDVFFKALPVAEQYLRLLAESPTLLSKFVEPLMYSPPMASLLKQSPHIIDCYVQGQWQYPEPFDHDFVLRAEGYELQLERLRRFVNEYLYQLYQSFFAGNLSPEVFQAALTDLAEHTLELALKLVQTNLGLDSNPISIIGMGKVALRKMSPLSDLDLIFIYQQDLENEQQGVAIATRFISRLQTAIATPMREGIVYELDTRLRPSGRSGAPTVNTDSFAKHHLERAHTWEHIALMPSRVIAGNTKPITQIDQIKRNVITKPRDLKQFKYDAYKMWQRLCEHRIVDVPLDQVQNKLRQGGLMQAEYIASCLILQQGVGLDASSVDFETLLAQTSGSDLAEVIQFWRIQQIYERLFGLSDQSIESLDSQFQQRLFEHSQVKSLSELLDKKQHCIKLVEDKTTDFFADVDLSASELEDWQERNVSWL